MPKDDNTWKLRASTPFIYESEENVAQKFIHGGRTRIPKSSPKTPKSAKSSKMSENNISSLKSQTFAPKQGNPAQTSTFKSKTCNFDTEMAASPVAISHKYYEYITDANAKFNVNGMGVFRKFKPDVPTITCKPQVFDWNLNLQQNILHKPKDSSADLRYNGKNKPLSPPPPPTPIPQSSRHQSRHQTPVRPGFVNKLDDNLSPVTLGFIKKIIRSRSRTYLSKSKIRSLDTDSDSTLNGIYVNVPSTSRTKPKNMRKVPKPQSNNKDDKSPPVKRLTTASKVSSNSKVFLPKVTMLRNRSAPPKNKFTNKRDATRSKAKKVSVAKKSSTKNVATEKNSDIQ